MKNEDIEVLKNGGIGVIPTDTIYGIVCSVFKKEALERIFEVKGRDENKPPVVVISDVEDLKKFNIEISDEASKFINKYWPGKMSVIFPISSDFAYLDKEKGLAIRLPSDDKLREFIRKTGPLATSSANLQNFPPAKNICEAKNYFGDKVDFYIDGGELNSLPSTLVKIVGDSIEVLREGAVKIER
ncbi:MAG: L-threonylcarbamoyladenylate synthase [Candidatus Paceibacterota bacterium]|jgi:L-threonylcarbamoyladenylate synthase